MKSPDKFLIGILVGVVVLLVTVFGVILTRPADEYQAEDTPEGVAHNYLLALQNEDYQRAYSYLSPKLRGYPSSYIDFKRNVEQKRWLFRNGSSVSLAILSSELMGDSQADVDVRETRFYSGDFFNSSQSTREFEIYLALENDQWKIKDSDSYFAPCWLEFKGCN